MTDRAALISDLATDLIDSQITGPVTAELQDQIRKQIVEAIDERIQTFLDSPDGQLMVKDVVASVLGQKETVGI